MQQINLKFNVSTNTLQWPSLHSPVVLEAWNDFDEVCSLSLIKNALILIFVILHDKWMQFCSRLFSTTSDSGRSKLTHAAKVQFWIRSNSLQTTKLHEKNWRLVWNSRWNYCNKLRNSLTVATSCLKSLITRLETGRRSKLLKVCGVVW